MLKFFRRIRLKLLDEGSLKKYLIYAIGEILLVVIGILIALQINNWNEQRKENVIELQYLERLVIDLANDSSYYADRIAEAELSIENLNKYIHEAYQFQESIKEIKQLFSHLFINTDHLTTQNSTYLELTSSGKLNIFKNESLKTSIIYYYRLNEERATEIEEFNLVSTEFLIESYQVVRNLGKFFPLESGPYNDPKKFLDGEWDFINNPASEKFQALEAMAFMYWFRNREHLGFFYELKSTSSVLNNQIKEYIDKKIHE